MCTRSWCSRSGKKFTASKRTCRLGRAPPACRSQSATYYPIPFSMFVRRLCSRGQRLSVIRRCRTKKVGLRRLSRWSSRWAPAICVNPACETTSRLPTGHSISSVTTTVALSTLRAGIVSRGPFSTLCYLRRVSSGGALIMIPRIRMLLRSKSFALCWILGKTWCARCRISVRKSRRRLCFGNGRRPSWNGLYVRCPGNRLGWQLTLTPARHPQLLHQPRGTRILSPDIAAVPVETARPADDTPAQPSAPAVWRALPRQISHDTHGYGRIPAFWFTLNCPYNYLYEIHRFQDNADSLRPGDVESRRMRYQWCVDNPDIVTFLHALRTELLVRLVMPALVPHSAAKPFQYWVRFEEGFGGNPHAHGLVYVDGNPSLDDLRDSARRCARIR